MYMGCGIRGQSSLRPEKSLRGNGRESWPGMSYYIQDAECCVGPWSCIATQTNVGRKRLGRADTAQYSIAKQSKVS